MLGGGGLRRRRRAGRTRWCSWAPTRRSRRTSGRPGPAAGRVQGRNSTVPLSHPGAAPRRGLGAHAADDLGRAGLRRARRQLVPPGRAARLAAGQRRGLRGQAPQPGARRRPGRWPTRPRAPVRVLWRREDVVRRGPKRPPLALGAARRRDRRGARRAAAPGSADLGAGWPRCGRCPGVEVEEVEVAGPPVSPDLRGAGWAEVLAARATCAAATGPARRRMRRRAEVTLPGRWSGPGRGAARATDRGDGSTSRCGPARCSAAVTLRSYALGAVHQALGLVWSEGIAVDEAGEPVDLTIRSFGILAAEDMPEVTVDRARGGPVAGQRVRRRLRRHAGRGVDRRGAAAAVAHPARRRAGAVAATWHASGGREEST